MGGSSAQTHTWGGGGSCGHLRSHQPAQPFVQDPAMPPLPPPNTLSQLEEACRRLEEVSTKTAKQRCAEAGAQSLKVLAVADSPLPSAGILWPRNSKRGATGLSRERAPSRRLQPPAAPPASSAPAPGSNQKSTMPLARRPPSPLLSAPLPPLLSSSLQLAVYFYPF